MDYTKDMTIVQVRNDLIAWDVDRNLIRTALHAGDLRGLYNRICADIQATFPESE